MRLELRSNTIDFEILEANAVWQAPRDDIADRARICNFGAADSSE